MGPNPPPPPGLLPSYSFIVSIAGESVRFSEVSGLEISREAVAYRHGLSFGGELLITSASRNHVSLTLRRGVMRGDGYFFTWLSSNNGESRAMTVSLVDASGTPAVKWNIVRAIPVKITGPTLNASSNEVALESLEVKAIGLTIDAGAP